MSVLQLILEIYGSRLLKFYNMGIVYIISMVMA
jgi:hypothetical protein